MSLERDGVPMDGAASQRRRLAILAYLAGSGGSVSRARLLADLWPESGSGRARHALSNALYAIRGDLGEKSVFSSGENLCLDPSVLEVDVALFEAAIREQRLEDAAQLYAGPFLDGFFLDSVEFERWIDSVRDRLASKYAAAVEQLAKDATERKDTRGAAGWWLRVANHDPHTAHGAMALMRALEAVGDPTGALKHAQVHAGLLAQDLDLGPDSAVEGLAREIRERMESGGSVNRPGRAKANPGVAGGEPNFPIPVEAETKREVSNSWRPTRGQFGGLLLAGAAGIAMLVAGALTNTTASDLLPGELSAIRKIAVLPLESLSPDVEQAYFAAAMTEVLTAELARLESLTVVSRTSASRFAGAEISILQIADALGVDAVIEGSVFRSGETVRVTAQLIDASTDEHVWAGSYEASLEDPIGLQRQVAQAIAEALSIRLSRRERARLEAPASGSQEAQEAFFKGVYQLRRFTPQAVRGAIEEFENATSLDSTFAAPMAALGMSYWILTQPMASLPAREGMPTAREWAQRALQWDPAAVDAHGTLGWVSLLYDRDLDQAERHFVMAIELQPNSPVGYNGLSFIQLINGSPDQAIAAGQTAVRLQRLDLSFRTALAELYYYTRRFDEALAELDEVVGIDVGFARAYMVRAWVLEAQKQWGQANEAYRNWEKAMAPRGSPVSPGALVADEDPTPSAYWRRRLEWQRNSGPALLAWAHAEAGEVDLAFEYLARAIEARSGQVMFLGVQPAWDNLRGDPRFDSILAQLALRAR